MQYLDGWLHDLSELQSVFQLPGDLLYGGDGRKCGGELQNLLGDDPGLQNLPECVFLFGMRHAGLEGLGVWLHLLQLRERDAVHKVRVWLRPLRQLQLLRDVLQHVLLSDAHCSPELPELPGRHARLPEVPQQHSLHAVCLPEPGVPARQAPVWVQGRLLPDWRWSHC